VWADDVAASDNYVLVETLEMMPSRGTTGMNDHSDRISSE
jgi:hypothetical protein